MPANPSPRREDTELFEQALAAGLLRLEADGRIAVAPADLPLRQIYARAYPALLVPRADGTQQITLLPRPRRSLVQLRGRRIQIKRQINFVTDSEEILPTSNALLAEIADVILRHPELQRIEIEGHTDDRGGADHNLELSQRRAEAVRRWLVDHGVEEGRLSARGYGSTRPLVPNITSANRARNRRVQLTVLESAE